MRTLIIPFILCSLTSCTIAPTAAQLAQVDTLHPAQFDTSDWQRPGVTSYSARLQEEVLRPCISIRQPYSKVSLLVSRLLLENLVSRGRTGPNGKQGTIYNDHIAKHASGLLLSESDVKDPYGCKQTKDKIPYDADSLLASLLRSGQVVAMNIETNKVINNVTVQYDNSNFEGDVKYKIEGEVIFRFKTWIR